MAAQMCDQVGDSKFYAPVHFSDKCVDRLLVEFILGTGKVGKIRHVIYYWSEAALLKFFSETLHLFWIQVAELPTPRVPREDLESITLPHYGCVYCIVEGFGYGDVDSNSNRKVSLVRGAVAV
jgi:hypothetical protein